MDTTTVDGWATDLGTIIGDIKSIQQSGSTTPVPAAGSTPHAAGGFSTMQIAAGVLALILVVVIVKKVL